MKDITVIIPSYNPGDELMLVLNNLIASGFEDIVVVNDGSNPAHDSAFRYAQSLPGCTVISHEFNMGKGMALKSGFSYFLKNRPEGLGVITVDGDNQHHIEDICAVEKKFRGNPDAVIMGARDFSSANVPSLSRLGNTLTRYAIRFISGMKLSDTQCGLRAIPAKYLPDFLQLKGERFEFETQMLFEIKGREIQLLEVPIRAIYFGDMLSFHYRPIKDTLLLGGLVFRFLAVSIISTLVDLGAFTLLNMLLMGSLEKSTRLLLATVLGRLVSSMVNFLLNRRAVFRNAEGGQSTLARFYAWAVVQMFLSYSLVFSFTELLRIHGGGESGAKLVIDFVLFFASFLIQRTWAFQQKKPSQLPPK